MNKNSIVKPHSRHRINKDPLCPAQVKNGYFLILQIVLESLFQPISESSDKPSI